jgi:hypothetical protein
MNPMEKSVSMSFRDEYVEQLKTKEWYQKRQEVLKHYGYKCVLTGKTENLQIHHFEKSYKYGKKAWEYSVEDLIPLCEEEHRKMHDLYRKCSGFKVPEGVVCELIWNTWSTLCAACYYRKKEYDEGRMKLLKFIDVCKEDDEISHDEEEQIIKKALELDQDMADEAKVIIRNFNASQNRVTSAGDRLEKENKKAETIIKATSDAKKDIEESFKSQVRGISNIISDMTKTSIEHIEDAFPLLLVNGLKVAEVVNQAAYLRGIDVENFLQEVDSEYEKSISNQLPKELLLD